MIRKFASFSKIHFFETGFPANWMYLLRKDREKLRDRENV